MAFRVLSEDAVRYFMYSDLPPKRTDKLFGIVAKSGALIVSDKMFFEYACYRTMRDLLDKEGE